MARLCIEAQANRQYPKSTRRCSYEKYIKLGFETWEVIHETHAHALGPKKMCTPFTLFFGENSVSHVFDLF